MFFPLHHVTTFLSPFSKEKFSEEVNRDDPNDKIKELFYKFDDFYQEMKHFQLLRSYHIPVDLTLIDQLKLTSFIFVILANLIQILSNPASNHGYQLNMSEWLIQGLGVIVMVINILIFLLWLIFSSKLDIQREIENAEDEL